MNIFLPCWVATCSIFRRTNWLLYVEKCLGQLFSMLLYRKSGDDFSTSLKKKLIRWFKLLIFIFIFIFMHEFVGMRGFLGQQKIVGGVEVSTQLFVCFKTQFIFFFTNDKSSLTSFYCSQVWTRKKCNSLTKQQDRKIKIASWWLSSWSDI